ncbi:hypothetical protein N9766_05990 [Flavobacteriaceae bacterium]|nr:hypothetical protein [Flavobacteriaceae bacterium]MDB4175888.1 hypothetical protein [Flavobacteriaceae bacterium]
MKKLIFILITVVVASVFTGCGTGIKIVDTWTSQDVSQMKQKSILVIASTNNKKARIGFESEIAKQLNAKGLNATASFSRFPTIDFEAEKTQKRKDLIKTILESEGYNGIVITVVKDVVERTITSGNDYYYTGGPWNSYYPSYYGGFYGYYATPYTYSYNMNIVGSSSTYTSKTYYLETIAYNLDNPKDVQLVALITSQVKDPKDAFDAAEDYAEKVVKSLEDKK